MCKGERIRKEKKQVGHGAIRLAKANLNYGKGKEKKSFSRSEVCAQ